MKENQGPQKGPVERPEPIDNPPDSRPDPEIKECKNCIECIQKKGGESYYYWCDAGHWHGKPLEKTKGLADNCFDYNDGTKKDKEDPAMKEWIEEMKNDDGYLSDGKYIYFDPNDPEEIQIGDYSFSTFELDALSAHMKRYQK